MQRISEIGKKKNIPEIQNQVKSDLLRCSLGHHNTALFFFFFFYLKLYVFLCFLLFLCIHLDSMYFTGFNSINHTALLNCSQLQFAVKPVITEIEHIIKPSSTKNIGQVSSQFSQIRLSYLCFLSSCTFSSFVNPVCVNVLFVCAPWKVFHIFISNALQLWLSGLPKLLPFLSFLCSSLLSSSSI